MGNAYNAFMLRQALTSAKYERKTGNLHVFTSFSGSLKNAILVVESGELIGCRYLDEVGKSAVRVLLQAVIVKTLFIQRDISGFTPHLGTPSIEEILSRLRSSQSADSAVQQPSNQSTPLVRPRSTGNLRRAAVFLANVIGEDKARQQVLEVTKQLSPDDNAEEFVETCIDLAASSVGEPKARMMFEEMSSSDGGNLKAEIAKDDHVAVLG